MFERGSFSTSKRIEINLMTQALIAFGANLGDVQACMDEAVGRIADHAEIEVIAVARPLVTTAVSGAGEGSGADAECMPDYLNSVIRVDTAMTADALFQFTRGLEDEMGRQRRQRWGSRTIDLDIVLFGGQIIDDPFLQVPHPRMSFRKFVIGPAAEIAGEMVDPVSGVSINDLAHRLQHSPKTILWIAGDERAAEALAAESLEGSNQGAWGFRIANNIDVVEAHSTDFRLMIFSGAQQKFENAALRFAGPWLNVTGFGHAQCRREVRAAIQAMAFKLDQG